MVMYTANNSKYKIVFCLHLFYNILCFFGSYCKEFPSFSDHNFSNLIQLIGNITFLSHAEYMSNIRNLKILMRILEEQHEGLMMQSLCSVWYHSPHCEPEKKMQK
jgi:hypothetical protein